MLKDGQKPMNYVALCFAGYAYENLLLRTTILTVTKVELDL